MTKQQLKALNASFGTIPNFGKGGGFSSYAILPYGGAYVLTGNEYTLMPNTNEVYDIQELMEFLFDCAY